MGMVGNGERHHGDDGVDRLRAHRDDLRRVRHLPSEDHGHRRRGRRIDDR